MLATSVASIGCTDPDRPWESPSGGSFAPLDLSAARASADVAPLPSGAPPPRTLFERCADGFTTSGRPVIDVTRLGLICGASLGLTRVREVPFEAALGARANRAAFEIKLVASSCYRFFVASDTKTLPVRITVKSEADITISSGVTRDGHLSLPEGSELCTAEDVSATVLVTAEPSPEAPQDEGRAHVALGVYRLARPSPSKL